MVYFITLDYASTIGSKVALLLLPIFIGWVYFVVNIEKAQPQAPQRFYDFYYYILWTSCGRFCTGSSLFLCNPQHCWHAKLIRDIKWFAGGLVNLLTFLIYAEGSNGCPGFSMLWKCWQSRCIPFWPSFFGFWFPNWQDRTMYLIRKERPMSLLIHK
jgi:hypothetical protein